jgi:hypothetical protein
MRITAPTVMGLLALLLISDTAQSQTRQFNPNCGLLGNFAQYRAHNQHCKTTEKVRTNVVPRTTVPDKCAPTLSRIGRGIGESGTTGLGGGAGQTIGGVL